MRRPASLRYGCVHTDLGNLSRNTIYRCECPPHVRKTALEKPSERPWCSCSDRANHTLEALTLFHSIQNGGSLSLQKRASLALSHKQSMASSTISRCTCCGDELITETSETPKSKYTAAHSDSPRDSVELARRKSESRRPSESHHPSESRRQSTAHRASEHSRRKSSGQHTPTGYQTAPSSARPWTPRYDGNTEPVSSQDVPPH